MALQIYDQCCNQCLFSKNRIVSLERKADLIRGFVRKQSHFICHKASIEGKEIVCRGFYDKMGHVSQMVRIAERLNAVQFIPQTFNP